MLTSETVNENFQQYLQEIPKGQTKLPNLYVNVSAKN